MSADHPGAHCPPPLEYDRLGKCCALLSMPMRLRILLLLARGELSVNALCEKLKAAQPTVSHHLGILRAAGVVDTRHAGRHRFYRLSGPAAGGGALTLYAAGCWIRLTVGPAPSPDA
jgi:DNA-binding transcriptional ArsR family regulator